MRSDCTDARKVKIEKTNKAGEVAQWVFVPKMHKDVGTAYMA